MKYFAQNLWYIIIYFISNRQWFCHQYYRHRDRNVPIIYFVLNCLLQKFPDVAFYFTGVGMMIKLNLNSIGTSNTRGMIHFNWIWMWQIIYDTLICNNILKIQKVIDPMKIIHSHICSQNLQIFLSYTFPTLPVIHPSNITLFQSYTLPFSHSSNLTLFQFCTFPILHPSDLTLFQSYTLSMLHSFNLTLFKSFTLTLIFQSYILYFSNLKLF